MRLIVQKSESGCGVACVAMLLGLSYKSALEHMGGLHPDGTDAKQIISALCEGGLTVSRKLVPLKKSYRELSHDAVLKAWPKEDGSCWHWVVWDSAKRRFLDPERRGQRYKRIRASHYIAVYKS